VARLFKIRDHRTQANLKKTEHDACWRITD